MPGPLRPARLLTLAAALIGTAVSSAAAPCDSAATREAALRLFAAIDARWQARDAEGMVALYSPDAHLRLEPDVGSATGRPALQKFFTSVLQGLPADQDHRLELIQVGSAGPLCTLDARATVGTHSAQPQRFQGFYVVKPVGTELRIVAVRAVALG